MSESLNTPAVIVGEAVAGEAAKRAAKVRIELEHLNNLVLDSTFDIAELLAEVKGAGYYGSWGYQTFEDYVVQVLDMKLRKAQYLISIVNTTKELGIPRAEYEDLGISKLREICDRLKTKDFFNNPATGQNEPMGDHIKRLIKDAPGMSVKEITEEVKRLKGLTGDDEIVHITLAVKRSVRDNVIIPAQEKARQILGSRGRDDDGDPIEYSDGQCEDVIHTEFLSGVFDEEEYNDAAREVEPADFEPEEPAEKI